jgi:ribosomal protein S27AE
MSYNDNNIRLHLQRLRTDLQIELFKLDNIIKTFDLKKNTLKCVKCNWSDVRALIKNNYFCRKCGYDTRLKNE